MISQDLRYAFRTFLRSPGFAILAVLTIAIGVGASTAVFSIVNEVLLRPLPFADADALVLVSHDNRQTKQNFGDASPANFLDWRIRNRSFIGLAAFRNATFTVSSNERPDRVGGAIVNANFFDVLGVRAERGRTFQPNEEGPGATRVAVLGEGLWKQRFGGRRDIIGHTIRLNDEPHAIVGVLPKTIDFPDGAQIWTPGHWSVPDDPLAVGDDPSGQRSHGYLFVIGRLKAGLTRAQAMDDMDRVASDLERDYPSDNQNIGAAVVSLRDSLVGDVRPMLLLLLAAVGVLLLIATANVSGLLIARATVRHQEVAMRMALGATRRRIIGQLLTESVLLALTGGAFGVLLAMWLVAPLAAIAPSDLRIGGDVHVDVRVLSFALAISMIAGVLFGLAPARQLTEATVYGDLKQSARGGTSPRQRRARAALVVVEIALSLVLLVGAGLTIKSFVRLLHVPTGFQTDHVLVATVTLPETRYAMPQQKADFWQRTLESLRQVPGIEMAAVASRLPLSGGNSTRGLTIDNAPVAPPAEADYRTASADYFRALGIPLLQGRVFRDDDRENRPRVALISASMATQYWPNSNPIGHQVAIDPDKPITIVGVVGDVRHQSLEAVPRPTFYVPYRQDPWPFMTFVLRVSAAGGNGAASATLQPSVRQAIWQIDKEQPVGALRSMEEQLSRSLTARRFSVTLLTAFGAIAAGLAAIGLYGVLAFIVAQRRREIGVRMALGAQSCDVITDVLSHGLKLTAAGVAIGIALALAATRLINSMLFATSPTDAATFAGVALLLVMIAAAASLVPALRASRVDPLVALRDE